MRVLTFVLLWFALSSVAHAHVVVSPRTSQKGAYEKYTVRVPTEGKVATLSVELTLPEGVNFVAVGAPTGHTYELKKSGERVVAIVWTMKISPNEFAEFSFMARNPKDGKELVWKAVQKLADGTTEQWSGPVGDRRPASVTTLSAGGAEHKH
ncbi:MAG TPA: DUF1775 domain-containing protein [Steroidobacteraceae bacterium]|nr:DUF1775 domain-containing protein [Steroidobacteraceae bacterium]